MTSPNSTIKETIMFTAKELKRLLDLLVLQPERTLDDNILIGKLSEMLKESRKRKN